MWRIVFTLWYFHSIKLDLPFLTNHICNTLLHVLKTFESIIPLRRHIPKRRPKMTCPLKHRSQPGIPRDLKQFYMYNLWEASHVANYPKLWALFAVPYSPSERTGRSPSSVVCCFSAFYINILFNLHQTCAGPTLFEVGMLLFSAHIYPFLLQHCIFLIRSASIPLLNLWGWRRGGGLCSHLFMLWTLLHRSLCDGFLRRVCDHKQEMLTLPWHLISPWACFYPWVRASQCFRSYT